MPHSAAPQHYTGKCRHPDHIQSSFVRGTHDAQSGRYGILGTPSGSARRRPQHLPDHAHRFRGGACRRLSDRARRILGSVLGAGLARHRGIIRSAGSGRVGNGVVRDAAGHDRRHRGLHGAARPDRAQRSRRACRAVLCPGAGRPVPVAREGLAPRHRTAGRGVSGGLCLLGRPRGVHGLERTRAGAAHRPDPGNLLRRPVRGRRPRTVGRFVIRDRGSAENRRFCRLGGILDLILRRADQDVRSAPLPPPRRDRCAASTTDRYRKTQQCPPQGTGIAKNRSRQGSARRQRQRLNGGCRGA